MKQNAHAGGCNLMHASVVRMHAWDSFVPMFCRTLFNRRDSFSRMPAEIPGDGESLMGGGRTQTVPHTTGCVPMPPPPKRHITHIHSKYQKGKKATRHVSQQKKANLTGFWAALYLDCGNVAVTHHTCKREGFKQGIQEKTGLGQGIERSHSATCPST